MPHKCKAEATQKESLKGHVVTVGDISIEGVTVAGVLVECSRDDLRTIERNLFGSDVVITPANDD